jgi:hypothetical protein
MASIDYGMALARGYIADTPTYKADILKKVGGANVFKQESWWNEQLNKAIKEGFTERTTERVGPNVFGARNRGEWSKPFSYFLAREGYESATPVMEKYYQRRGRGNRPGQLPITTPNVNPRFYTVREKRIGWDAVKATDVTTQVLNKIEAATKRRGEVIRGETEKLKKTSRRARRGLGGLVAKAPLPGEKTGALPLLGETGLAGSEVGLGTALNLKG